MEGVFEVRMSSNGKIIKFPGDKDEMLPLEKWDWSAFKAVWEAIATTNGEDAAWQVVYELWERRTGKSG